MKQIGYIKLENTIGERTYTFSMPIASPLGECYDSLHLMLREVVKMSQEAVERTKREEAKVKEAKVEVIEGRQI